MLLLMMLATLVVQHCSCSGKRKTWLTLQRITKGSLAPVTKETSLRVDPVADCGMPLQVGAALAVHAAYCVKDCSTTVLSWANTSAADILHTVQKHAFLLLQVASDHQVIV